mmetsp:Transcript_11361/g.33294  ORF Transcript_11361/g.33294 Transcript_11361/m.33294 type:complete len:284 (+) Transcript_11361:137-988(+)
MVWNVSGNSRQRGGWPSGAFLAHTSQMGFSCSLPSDISSNNGSLCTRGAAVGRLKLSAVWTPAVSVCTTSRRDMGTCAGSATCRREAVIPGARIAICASPEPGRRYQQTTSMEAARDPEESRVTAFAAGAGPPSCQRSSARSHVPGSKSPKRASPWPDGPRTSTGSSAQCGTSGARSAAWTGKASGRTSSESTAGGLRWPAAFSATTSTMYWPGRDIGEAQDILLPATAPAAATRSRTTVSLELPPAPAGGSCAGMSITWKADSAPLPLCPRPHSQVTVTTTR